MAEGFAGVPKEDFEVLKKAAEMYTKLTGEEVKALGMIPVAPDEDTSLEAKQKAAEEELKATAEAAKQREEAQQAERRIKSGLNADGTKKDGKDEPTLAPLAASQQEGAASPRGKKGEPANVTATTSSPKSASVKVTG